MDDILTYAERSADCAEEVLSWIYEVLQEGIKDILFAIYTRSEERRVGKECRL